MDEEKMKIYPGLEITLTEPLTINVDKEYFELKFRKVFKKWESDIGNGLDMLQEKQFFNELMDCF